MFVLARDSARFAVLDRQITLVLVATNHPCDELAMSDLTLAFVDESGTPSLNLGAAGTSSHFVVAVVLLRGQDADVAREAANRVRASHFRDAEMKSSSVGQDDDRRIRILNDLRGLPVSFYGFVVDKRRIWKDSGLIFKRPFLKFLSGKVYSRIYRTFSEIHVVADQHGTDEFMDGFVAYVRENHQPTLFEGSRFSFVKSETEPLVQVADIVAGTVARLFEEKRKSPRASELLASMHGKLLCLEEWPPVYHELSEEISATVAHDHDGMVEEYCKNRVALYLEEFADTDDSEQEPTRLREAVLTFLASQSRQAETDHYISAGELLRQVADMGLGEPTLHVLRSKVIAHFRDHGVIIASNNAGYKVPTKVSDISDYVARCDAVAQPLILRLKQAREQIQMISHGSLDIVSEPKFAFLKRILESSSQPSA